MTNKHRLEINCDISTQKRLSVYMNPLLESKSDARYIERKNLDGSSATWIVIASLAVQALPHVLKFLSDIIKDNSVTKIKVGDVEIENPTEADLVLLRKRIEDTTNDNA